nr:hypothetical protein [Tanacetum cinerariifolium]
PPTLTPTTTVVAAPRLSATAKGKQHARVTTPTELIDIERTEAEQLKIVLKRSKQETNISQQRGSSTDEGTGFRPGVLDVPSDDSEEELSWNFSDDEEGEEQTKAGSNSDKDNDDNDAEEEPAKNDDEDTESGKGGDEVSESEGESDEEETRQEEEESFDLIPRTSEGIEDECNDEEDQELRLSEEARIQEEEEADELYRDVNINQGRGLQVTQNIEDSHVTLTPFHPDGPQESSSVSSLVTSMLNPISDAGVESIFTTASSPIVSLQTPTPIINPSIIATITTSSDAPISPTTIPSIILENLPTFNSAFRFDERLRSLETTFSEYRQTNPFIDAVSAILENDEFLRNIDENMKKIIKGQVKSQVKDQVSRILPRIEESVNATLEDEVLTRSSHSSRTSYAIAADLSETELKKILIEKMEGNKSIQRSEEQRNLYKALVEAYDADKDILDTYGELTILKRRREDDDQEGPSGSDRGSKRQREGGEHASASTPSEIARQLSASESAFAEEPIQTTCQMEEPPHPVFEKGADDQPIVQTSQHPEWFSQPRRPLSPDRDWNKTLPAAQGDAQSWISDLAKQTDARSSFNELFDTPINFSNFIMNQLNVDTLTPALLAGPTYELMRGSCTSLTELEYHLEEVYKATTDQLDWVNPEGQQYPHNLLSPLPLIPDNRGRRVIPFEHFINNDLKYLRGGTSSRKYTTSVTKTKAADYGHIKWIEDLVPRAMWIQEPINYDRHALWGVSNRGWKRQQFYGFAVNRESALDVYSNRRIITVTELKIMEWHDYKHLDWISVRQDDDKIYKFKEEEMATVLTSMDAATVLASGAAEVPTGSGSIPTASSPAAEVSTGSDVVPTASPIFAIATVVTPYRRRKGKEIMVESKTLKKKKESVKKLKTLEEVPKEAKSPDEVPEEKVKEMMQLVPIEEDKEIFIIVEKDYPLRKGLAIVMICYKLQLENYSQMANHMILKIYKIANCPSQQVMEFPLPGEVPTSSKETSHCKTKREATAVKIALLLKSRRNYQSKSDDCYTKLVPHKALKMMDSNLQVMVERRVNAVSAKTNNELPFDPKMPELEDTNTFTILNKDEDDDAEADINDLDIAIQKKARLVAQGHTQEEAIDYDEGFSPIVRIEEIRLFLAYASFKDFVVYQMDAKSTFLYGKIEEEVYVCQPPGFKDHDFPDKVYKFEKALHGLHQAPRAWHKDDILLVQVYVDDIIFGLTKKELLKQKQDGIFISQDKYVAEILKKYGFLEVKNASTLMETQKPLLKEEDAYTDSDYAGASLDKKSTTGGCQYLGCRLISWQCKKQTVDANFITEAEYMAASSCCGQVLWIQNQLLDY